MHDGIDNDAIIAQLQSENERLREMLTKIKLQPHWFQTVNWYNIKKVLSNPYFIVGYLIGVFFALFLCYTGRESNS